MMDQATVELFGGDGRSSGPIPISDLEKAAQKLTGKPRLKQTPADKAVSDAAYSVTARELLRFIERYERLVEERVELSEDMKQVMAEAKSRGYDTKALKIIIRDRKRGADVVAEEAAVVELYKAALGMA